MRASLIMILTFVFGIVPATLLFVLGLIFGAAGIWAVGQAAWVGNPKTLLGGMLFLAIAVGAVPGYVGLFYAAGNQVTPRSSGARRRNCRNPGGYGLGCDGAAVRDA